MFHVVRGDGTTMSFLRDRRSSARRDISRKNTSNAGRQDTWYAYKAGALRMTEIANRYKKSIAERIIPPPVRMFPSLLKTVLNLALPQVWTAHVQNSPSLGTSTATTYPALLMANIFDPIFIDSADAQDHADPFSLRDLSMSCEVNAYHRLESLQGTRVPRFCGHFITPLPSQHNRTVKRDSDGVRAGNGPAYLRAS